MFLFRSRFLDRAPAGVVYAAMCIVVRIFEGLSAGAFMTSSLSIMAANFPKHTGKVVVSTAQSHIHVHAYYKAHQEYADGAKL